jgi:hypothetical protein
MHPAHRAVLLDQLLHTRVQAQTEGGQARRLVGHEVEKTALGHQRDIGKACAQVAEVGHRLHPGRAGEAHRPDLAVRQLEEPVRQAQLVQQLERGRMDGVAAEIAVEVAVRLQQGDGHAATCQQEGQHDPRRPAANNHAARVLVRHPLAM